jgi:hypothetical protein
MGELEAAATQMPMWLNVFTGIVLALGGLEFFKWIFSLDIFRRKGKAEAKEAEANAHQQATTAEQQEAELRRHELETAYQMIEQMKQQNAYLGEQIKLQRQEKEEDRKIKGELRMKVAEHERILIGIQKAWNIEMSKKRDAERHYCGVENCSARKPRMGEYETETTDLEAIIAQGGGLRSKKQKAKE